MYCVGKNAVRPEVSISKGSNFSWDMHIPSLVWHYFKHLHVWFPLLFNTDNCKQNCTAQQNSTNY